ncbi:hypothetical protein PUNSTDRAFT_147005 [Punctularia strigosozonata HHB-11173 SS5]|uniref:Uncharacterized protein n=1 Tax=Punctularia strigosozonata (strain HHB-11173) TaxID=741275 RepID=R7S2U4_PUNST|nr:uncharacterized protein PUNSTDRAFT_147005 [Punctularia strigosozonata HHB-11173 SS5]EIN03571.1 hypothetical protein PUNSTDRAFT_147005 [Punctularia strigosozonata HHB-11173 SS5]
MSTDEDFAPERSKPDVRQHYLTQYREHLASTNSHLAGDDGDPLPPSFVPPAGFWTSSEKSKFFHGLCVHSRLRPDLIAASIETKSVLDVCAYIDSLEAVIRSNASDDSDGEDEIPIGLEAFEPAFEVSEEWIALEESAAEGLIVAEPSWAVSSRDHARNEELRERRNSMRQRRSVGPQKGRDRAGQQVRKKEWEQWRDEREKEWAREDLLEALDAHKLKAMDAILRDGEERRRQTVVPNAPQGSRFASPATPGVHSEPSNDDTPIDPASPSEPLDAGTSGQASRLPSLTPEPSADLLESLSPRHRRQLQKRLWMRRKRAEARGVAPSLTVERQKPGRKRKVPDNQGDVAPDTIAKKSRSIEDDDDVSDRESSTGAQKNAHQGGITLHYKLKALFADLDLDYAGLHKNGLDFFRVAALGRLIRLYASRHSADEDVQYHISASVVQQLYSIIVAFIEKITRRAITVTEQERRTKLHTKVWRKSPSDILTAHDVEYALSITPISVTGEVSSDEKDADEPEDGTSSSAAPTDTRKRSGSTKGARRRTQRTPTPAVPHVHVHTVPSHPFVRLPPTWSHERAELGPAPNEDNDGDLMPQETDEEELLAELQEDEEQDKRDLKLGAQVEKSLWAVSRREEADQSNVESDANSWRTGGEEDTDARGSVGARVKRRARSVIPRSRIRSKEFIEDSE